VLSKKFLQFVFSGVNVEPQRFGSTNMSSNVLPLVSWTLAVVLILSLIGAFIVLGLGKEVPDFIQGVIAGIVGYFGGCFASYQQVAKGE
jgi:hypothetical protein